VETLSGPVAHRIGLSNRGRAAYLHQCRGRTATPERRNHHDYSSFIEICAEFEENSMPIVSAVMPTLHSDPEVVVHDISNCIKPGILNNVLAEILKSARLST
jgi:hypothetical protein